MEIPTRGHQTSKNFASSLERLGEAARNGYPSLATAAITEAKWMSKFEMPCSFSSRTLTVDAKAQQILNTCLMSEIGTPYQVFSNGSCLFDSVSVALCGTQKLSCELRVRTCLEMIRTKDIMLARPDAPYLLMVSPNYISSVFSCALDGGYSSIWTMYALSNVIGLEVESVYPPMNGKSDRPFTWLNRIIKPRYPTKNPRKIKILWTRLATYQTGHYWYPDHFVPVMSKEISSDLTNATSTDNPEQTDAVYHWESSGEINIDSLDEFPPLSNSSRSSSMDSLRQTVPKSPLFSYDSRDFDVSDKIDDIDSSIASDDNEDKYERHHDLEDMEKSSSTTDSITNSLPDGKFLDTETIISLLTSSTTNVLDKIPRGKKNNLYFVIDNKENHSRRDKKQKSTFPDDCGVWDTSTGSTPKTTYIKTDCGLKKVFVKEGVCCVERMKNKKRVYEPIVPPPTNILQLHRYYTSLKVDKTYKKRVSWLGLGSTQSVAVVEYLGDFPGLVGHGNAKTADDYTRIDDKVMTKIGQMVKTMKPMDVYKELNRDFDELDGPTNVRQIRDKKRRDKIKERQNNRQLSHNNIADHILQIQNMVQDSHPFVRHVIHDNGKTPTVILYNNEQLTDIQRLCCTGQTVLGFDKTFNLCDMHVTASCFKQLTVDRAETGEPPLFFGPIFIHDNSDFETYSAFFSHLRIKLTALGCDFEKLVIGTDDEKALKKSITTIFPESTHVLCTRHLKQNTIDKLTNIGVSKKERNDIIHSIYGQDGLTDADDSIVFETRSDDIEQRSGHAFQTYFTNRLKPVLYEKVNKPMRQGHIDKQWTNNNCESVNHILKQTIDWKSKPLLDFIELTHTTVTNQYKDLRRALVGLGQYRLADTHKHFKIDKVTYASKTVEQRDRLFAKFRSYNPTTKDTVVTTDGRTQIKRPRTHGKKPGQRKRKRTERTVTL